MAASAVSWSDLLRTLTSLLRRQSRPEFIVVETSSVADQAEIVRNLMDPVICRESPLETVLCVVDASAPVAALQDLLSRSQLREADLVALSKPDLANVGNLASVREGVRSMARSGAIVVEAPQGAAPEE